MSFYISRAAIWLFSLLPFSLLYAFSDFVYFLMYYLIGYRKQVTFDNLSKTFPEKSPEEIKKISKNFYRYHLCDIMVEITKIRHISKRQILKRVKFKNLELLDKYYDSGKSLVVSLGHCGNWEWMAMNLALISKYEVFAIIKPFTDKKFDTYFDTKLRSRFVKGRLIPYKMALRTIIKNKSKRTLNLFATDQAPAKNEIDYWTFFLNRETAVYLGIEKIARALDLPVVFFDIQRIKRGYYEVEVIDICNNPSVSSDFEITGRHVKTLERCIRKNPYNWLWSHRRWKHKKEEM